MTYSNQQQKYALFQQTRQQVPMVIVSDLTSSMPNDVVDTMSHTCVPDISIPSADCSVAENVPLLSISCNEFPLCSPASMVSPSVLEPVTDLILERLSMETMSDPKMQSVDHLVTGIQLRQQQYQLYPPVALNLMGIYILQQRTSSFIHF